MLEADEREALRKDRLIDITTTGRKTGQPHRIEVGLYQDGDQIYLTGRPGRRNWLANLNADPKFTLHLKQSIQRDLPASAHPIVDEPTRRAFFTRLRERWGASRGAMDVDQWTAGSPLVRVEFDD